MTEQKTIGQIAHEAVAGITPAIISSWDDINPWTQNTYEIMASAVWDEALKACIGKIKYEASFMDMGEKLAAARFKHALRSLKRLDNVDSDND